MRYVHLTVYNVPTFMKYVLCNNAYLSQDICCEDRLTYNSRMDVINRMDLRTVEWMSLIELNHVYRDGTKTGIKEDEINRPSLRYWRNFGIALSRNGT